MGTPCVTYELTIVSAKDLVIKDDVYTYLSD
jgi:hypothetical protein